MRPKGVGSIKAFDLFEILLIAFSLLYVKVTYS